MDICILDGAGQVLVHRNVPSTPVAFLWRVVSDTSWRANLQRHSPWMRDALAISRP